MKNTKLKGLILAALLAALTAVFSQIAIPLPFTPVPINLATLAVFLAGGLLGARYGLISQVVYMLLGLVGLPVFAQFTGGPGILFGPTGGYIAGYAIAAFAVGLLFDKTAGHALASAKNGGGDSAEAPKGMALRAVLYFVVGMLCYYIPGTLWFMAQTGNGLGPSLVMCVVPFLPGDALKVAAAVLLTGRLRPLMRLL